MPRQRFKIINFSCIIFFLLFTFTFSASTTPSLISYQGKLTDAEGSPLPDSTYLLDFTIYDDSLNGNLLWTESNSVSTSNGLFNHILGSINTFPANLFMNNQKLYLDIQVSGELLSPRILLASVPYAIIAGNLKVTDSNDSLAIITSGEEHKFVIYGADGAEIIKLQDATSDSAVILPDSSINADELLNEPGIAMNVNIDLIPLVTGVMNDLVDVTITIPENGYIVLNGKCYLLLSGTTGPNTAIAQIDETEGGGTQFPYYTIAGLSGYVNSSTNYFPVYVTRVYYKQKGTYTFRMEGRASNPLPAQAQSWDHVLIARYYPTSYHGVMTISNDPIGFPEAIPIIVDDNDSNRIDGMYYKIDLRHFERQDNKSDKKQD